MRMNIPCRSNPFPYYVGEQVIDLTTPLTFKNYGDITTTISFNSPCYYNLNNEGWNSYNSNTSINIPAGQKIMFSGNISTTSAKFTTSNSYNRGSLKVYGNIMSLRGFNNDSLYADIFYKFLYNNKNVTDASQLLLPASSLVGNCYHYMFGGTDCAVSSLPQTPSTATFSDRGHFDEWCRFNKAITKAKMNLQSISQYTYSYTFESCSNLSCVQVGLLEWSAQTGASQNWLSNTNSSGIFIKPSSLALTRGSGRIPYNWFVLNRVDGLLYYAEATGGHAAGDLYQGQDPFK